MFSRRGLATVVAVFVVTAGTSPAWAAPTRAGSESGDDAVAQSAARAACAQVGRAHCGLIRVSREGLGAGIAQYTYLLKVGPGQHDRIQVHRVVRESRPGNPARAGRAVFFAHGDIWGFSAAFAGAQGGAKRAPNVASHLAARGLDAWGIDLRWVLVPAATTDLSFMHGWGIATNVSDLRLATTFERLVRTATGSGHDKTALVGWSKGATLAYAYAGAETRLPAAVRNVDALVPADGLIHYSPRDDQYRLGLCEAYEADKADHDSGTPAVSLSAYAEIGQAALDDPDGPSEFIPGLTNRQAALLVGGNVSGGFNAGFHFVTARFDAAGSPTGLRYTTESRWLRLMLRAAPWESLGDFVDSEALYCGEVAVPFDDHLGDVRVPVLYLAAAGGFGTTGIYSTTLLSSKDVTIRVIRLLPRGQESDDLGHVDLWSASNAAGLVWDPLVNWLRRH